MNEAEEIDMVLLGEAMRLSQEDAVGASTGASEPTRGDAKASGGGRRAAASLMSFSDAVVAEDVEEDDEDYDYVLFKASSSEPTSTSTAAAAAAASSFPNATYDPNLPPHPTWAPPPPHVVASVIRHPPPSSPARASAPAPNSTHTLSDDEMMWARVWAKELDVLASMGFNANVPELVALLKANVAEGPASLSPSLNGVPSPRGMQRVLDLLL